MTKDTRYKNHNELVNQVLLYIHSNYEGRFWSNPTGALKTDKGHFQRYGLKGSADILGISGDGLFVAIEVKTGSAVLNPGQKNFRDMINKFGGVHIIIHNDIKDEDFIKLRRKE